MKWSAVAVLRAASRTLDVDQFVTEHGLAVERVWRRGQHDSRGEVLQESGFNLTVADVASPETLRREVSIFLGASRGMRAALAAVGARLELDVGLMVYARRPISVDFPSELLRALATEGIALHITAYPCSEDEDDEKTT